MGSHIVALAQLRQRKKWRLGGRAVRDAREPAPGPKRPCKEAGPVDFSSDRH